MMWIWWTGIGLAAVFEPEIALATALVTLACLGGLWLAGKMGL